MGINTSLLRREKSRPLPTNLNDLLEESHSSSYWLSRFRNYCVTLDEKNDQTWRIRTMDFVLALRRIKDFEKKEESQKFPNEKLQNIVNERDQCVIELYHEFLKSDCLNPVAMSSAYVREKLVEVCVERISKGPPRMFNEKFDVERAKRRKLYETIWEAHNDALVWQKLDKLYEKFLKTSPSSSTLAVLLSLL